MKILIPLDGSKFAEEVLEPVGALATSSNAEVHLIEVVKPSEAGSTWTKSQFGVPHSPGRVILPELLTRVAEEGGGGVAVETSIQAEERLRREAQEYLDGIADRFFPQGAATQVVMGEEPAAEIVNYARLEKVNLIAIATHGRTGMARLTMGSVAGELLRARVAPIFMVRPDSL